MAEDTESGLGVLQLVKMHAAGQISLELFKSIQLGLWSVRSCPWSNVLPIVGLEGPNDQLQLLPTLSSMIWLTLTPVRAANILHIVVEVKAVFPTRRRARCNVGTRWQSTGPVL